MSDCKVIATNCNRLHCEGSDTVSRVFTATMWRQWEVTTLTITQHITSQHTLSPERNIIFCVQVMSPGPVSWRHSHTHSLPDKMWPETCSNICNPRLCRSDISHIIYEIFLWSEIFLFRKIICRIHSTRPPDHRRTLVQDLIYRFRWILDAHTISCHVLRVHWPSGSCQQLCLQREYSSHDSAGPEIIAA